MLTDLSGNSGTLASDLCGVKRRTQWLLAAGAAAVITVILELVGEWSAGIELGVVAIIFFVVAFRANEPEGPVASDGGRSTDA